MKFKHLLTVGGLLLGLGATSPVLAQADQQYLGQLIVVGYNFCPNGWMDANGQLLSIANYNALFALYGTTYGGNGTTTFALPDLQGRASIHQGTGPGLPTATQGQQIGSPSTTLTVSQMPAHNHALLASTGGPATPSPQSLATYGTTPNVYAGTPGAMTPMSASAIGSAGNNLPFDQYQPSLVMRYCVAMNGIFPTQN